MGVEVRPEAFVGGLAAEVASEGVAEAPVGVWAALASPEVGDGGLIEVLQDEVVGGGLRGGEVDDDAAVEVGAVADECDDDAAVEVGAEADEVDGGAAVEVGDEAADVGGLQEIGSRQFLF